MSEQIVMPINSGLREAYTAILKTMYLEEKEDFWLEEIVSIISADCGVSVDTAKDKCKQLIRFSLLKYLNSSLSGHRYRVVVFSKSGEAVNHVDSWEQFEQLVKDQLGEIVETDLVKIRRSMNTPGQPQTPGLRDKREVATEVASVFEKLDISKPIKLGEDIIKSEFKTLTKESHSETAEILEKALRNSTGNEPTEENSVSSEK